MEIKLNGNQFDAYLEGKRVGEMTWSNAGEGIIIIDHTYVHPDYRGKNIAESLVAAGVDYAREVNKKVMPLCPFATREFQRKPEYQDVLKK